MPTHTKAHRRKNKIKVTQGAEKKKKPSSKPRKVTKKIRQHDI